jgi:hypothetical protein
MNCIPTTEFHRNVVTSSIFCGYSHMFDILFRDFPEFIQMTIIAISVGFVILNFIPQILSSSCIFFLLLLVQSSDPRKP